MKRFCNGSFPDVALVLLGKDTPFVRMYMKGDVDAWNADGGASARARLRFDEEMLVLRRRVPPANGMVVGSGGAGYLVMRWDGNCYTLEDGELTPKKPTAPRQAPIPWRLYAESTKTALLAAPKVLAAYQKRGKECKGAVSGEVTLHSDEAYIQVSCDCRGGRVLFRRCRNRRDYCGDPNHFATIEELTNATRLAARICRELRLSTPPIADLLAA